MNTTFTKKSAQGMIRNLKTIILLLVPLLVIGCTEDCNPLNPNINVDECRKDDNIFATLQEERDISAALRTNTTRLEGEVTTLSSNLTASQAEVIRLQGMVETLTPGNEMLTGENIRLAAIERRWNALTGQRNITHQLFLVNRTQRGTQANWTLPLINTTIHFQDPTGNNYTLEWQEISPEN